jgi:hypothetical protein
MPKSLVVTIPDNEAVPEIIVTFSPEENYLMLKIGSSSLLEGRKVVAGLTQKEINHRIKEETKKEIHKLEMEILLEKELTKKMEERISKMYEGQIYQINKKLENALYEIEAYKEGNLNSLNEEVNKVKQKYDMLLEEKDRQNQLNRELFDKAVKLLDKTGNKSSISLGDSGEQIFENLADTFKDFTNFNIENKSKQSHKGDFHLFFKDFNILVDAKNYTSNISKKEILKIETDLNTNGNMNFAWLVSLNTNICEYNKFPITPKWITTDDGKVKCILMINNLLDNKEPRNSLRLAWQICDDFYRLTRKVVKDDIELEKMREKNLIYKKDINNLQENAYDLRRSMNTSLNVLKTIDNQLLEMLSNISEEMVNEKFTVIQRVKEWWNYNVEYSDNNEDKIISTELWNKFKNENKDFIGDNKITIENFKDTITGFVNSSNYVEKTKKGAIEFMGFKWKEEKKIEKKEEVIDNLEIENIIIEKKSEQKKVKKQKNTNYYFDEDMDKKVLNEYENEINDIMTMSNDNIRPWQIVSLLMRYKILNKRDEARGYDKYKETEEYKSKLKSA